MMRSVRRRARRTRRPPLRRWRLIYQIARAVSNATDVRRVSLTRGKTPDESA
jgi:hypothetical protein